MALADALRTFMYVSLWGKPVISVARGLSGFIKSIFRAGEQGFAYDINDLSTLFQDAAGTIPVTAAGQPVGLVLDKSKGLVVGSEKITNGNFANGTDGWFGINGTDEVVSGGFLNFTNAVAGNPNASQPNIISPSKWYKVSFRVANRVAGAVFLMAYATNPENVTQTAQITTDGVYTAILRAPIDANGTLGVRVTANSTLSITDVSVKELAGNHAYQTTSASRPLLQRNATTGAYYLAFDGTDDFLVTNSIDFTATDKVSLFAGVRKLVDTAAVLAELSVDSNTTTGNFLLSAPNTSATYTVRFKGTLGTSLSLTGYLPPHSAVLFAKGSIANKLQVLRVNGVSNANQFSDMGTGNYGNYPLYIGRRGGTTLPFNGHLYSLVGVARLTTDSETTSLEKAIAKNVGVPL